MKIFTCVLLIIFLFQSFAYSIQGYSNPECHLAPKSEYGDIELLEKPDYKKILDEYKSNYETEEKIDVQQSVDEFLKNSIDYLERKLKSSSLITKPFWFFCCIFTWGFYWSLMFVDESVYDLTGYYNWGIEKEKIKTRLENRHYTLFILLSLPLALMFWTIYPRELFYVYIAFDIKIILGCLLFIGLALFVCFCVKPIIEKFHDFMNLSFSIAIIPIGRYYEKTLKYNEIRCIQMIQLKNKILENLVQSINDNDIQTDEVNAYLKKKIMEQNKILTALNYNKKNRKFILASVVKQFNNRRHTQIAS